MAVGLLAIGASAARADEILFNNGDRLTGTIVSAEAGKMTIKTAVAGKVEVDLKDVKTFSSDGPVTLKLKDGTIIKQPVKAADAAGTVQVQPGAVQGQAVPLASVKSINPQDQWTGSVVAGGLLTRGNSDTDAFNIAFSLTRRTDDDRFNINGQYLFGRQRNVDTGEKTTATDNWRVGAKYDHFISEKFYGFGSINIEKDRIAALNIRAAPAVGVGYQWVERPDFNFNTEAGLAFLYEDFETGGSNESVTLRLAYHLDKEVRKGVTVFHNLAFYPSIEDVSDYLVQTDAGIRAELTEKMFTELKVELRYDSTPAPDASRSDLRYILGVGWNF
jgi:putative salt-induced outer membrane protein YdiY